MAGEKESVAEFTAKAVGVGLLLGILFGAANAYLGLRVGLTVSASIPAAVLTVAVFRLLRLRHSILELNISQTVSSTSTSLVSGTIFTIPALYLWGLAPPYLQVVSLCFLGGLLGLTAMIPLRRMLIVEADRELPYPEGRACAEVLKATQRGASGSAWIFRGMAVGLPVKLALALFFLVPEHVRAELPIPPAAAVAVALAPALLGVGYILGFRASAVMMAGGVIGSIVLIPLIAIVGERLTVPLPPEPSALIGAMSPSALWSGYLRYVGAGAVAMAGIVTVLRTAPDMARSFASVVRGLGRGKAASGGGASTDRDLPGAFIVGSIALVVLAAALVPGVFGGELGLVPRVVCALGVALFGILFVTVAARIVGIVGVSSQPTSGIMLITLIGIAAVFAAQGWTSLTDRAAVLTVGTIVAIAASKAGDISQDLKTGWLVGATPARQQLGQLIAAAVACWAVAGTVLLLGQAYAFGSADMPAPQAMLAKTIVEGVLAGELPWDLVSTGAGLSLGAMLLGASGLSFAIGVYLPFASIATIFVGGCVRGLVEKKRAGSAEPGESGGVLAASGLVAGEGLAGVVVAGLVAADIAPKTAPAKIAGVAGELATVAGVLLVCAFLFVAGRSRSAR